MKKIISILFCFVMISVSAIIVSAQAENTAEVLQFIVAPSQYTNRENFGLNIQDTVNGKSSVTSLGNFGGFVTYKFSQPIINSDKNPCGIDFIVNGNSFNGTAGLAEPGQVWVSQNGVDWYALAGSEHYENDTVWDYSVTYIKPDGYTNKCNYIDSLGDSGAVSSSTASFYPDSSFYKTVDIPENNLTLSGILLKKMRIPSTSNIVETQFGYVDAKLSSSSRVPSNPYLADPEKNCKDGQFDISWAVDKAGFGVSLDWIKYVRVQSACFIDSGVFGEKSTEVSSITVVTPEENSIKTTQKPTAITVNGVSLDLEGENNCFSVPVKNDTPFDVSVESDANVYINNTHTTLKHFESTTTKGIIRIIVQKDNCQPLIYYIETGSTAARTTVTLSESKINANVGDSVSLIASSSDGGAVTWTSSDENIAIVKDGVVHILSKGSVTVTATNKSGAFASCVITATESSNNNEKENNCSCNCHKSGFMSFIWKIQRFFYKIFRINQYCKCDAVHY